jgi:hypothetical protein
MGLIEDFHRARHPQADESAPDVLEGGRKFSTVAVTPALLGRRDGARQPRRIAVEMLIVFFGVVAGVVVDAVAMVRWRVQQCRTLSGSFPV